MRQCFPFPKTIFPWTAGADRFPPSVRFRSSTKKVFSKGSWTPPRSMTSLLFIKTQTSLAPHLDGSGTVHEDGWLGYRPQDTNCSPKTHHHHERWRRGQGYKRRTRASQEWSRSCDSCCPNLKSLANAKEGQRNDQSLKSNMFLIKIPDSNLLPLIQNLKTL